MPADELARFREECEAAVKILWEREPKTLVFGEGKTPEPPLMLIGEAPGEQETAQCRPFVGKAGKNLNEFLIAVGLTRSELYISNVVKFRPTRISAAARTVNRPPTREEIERFKPWLYREIALVRPRALVTLGNVALGAFLPRETTVGMCHGTWQTVTFTTPEAQAVTRPLFALYHPASVIYNRSLASVYQNDLETLRHTLADFGVHMDD
jgi:uracil-DNA glycosylase